MRRIRVSLRNISLLTIGSAYPRLGVADICVVRAGNSVFIPGSSIKGVLRTSANRASRRMNFTSCGEVRPDRIAEAHRKMGRRCDVCDLFGFPGSPPDSSSKVIVGDMKPRWDVRTIVIGRTAIDPRKGKALEGSLREVEAIPPCTIFEGEILLLSDELKHLMILLGALDEMRYMSFGRSSMVDVIAEIEGERGRELEIARSLSKWRWEICP